LIAALLPVVELTTGNVTAAFEALFDPAL